MYTYIALLAATALAAPAPGAEPLRVPLNRAHHYQPRADGAVDGAAMLRMLNATLSKYNAETLPTIPGVSDLLEKRANNLPLTDQVETGKIDELYYGPAIVGATTPQTFTIDFDTGSADFFVPGPQCTKAKGCVGNTKYDQGGTNRKTTTSVTYGSGSVSGNDYFDKVCVAGLCAPQTNVISLTTAQGFSSSASQGLMGMGFSTIANSKQPTFFERLIALKRVSVNEFSFYLGRAKSGTQGKSEMTLGGRDASRFTGTPKANKVTKKGYWQIALDGVKVGGTQSPGSAGQAAIDTGTTIILAPTVAATAIFAQIPGSVPVPMGQITLFAYPCNTAKAKIPKITFGGVDYQINPLDFNFGTLTGAFKEMLEGAGMGGGVLGGLPLVGGGVCLAGIGGADLQPTENLYVVGDGFLKNWYSIYNYDNGASVSFAKAK